MKKTLNKKYGFSLFEAVVVMGIVAIFVASATNVFTKKHKQVQEKTPHGRFECYYSGDQLVQQLFTENMSQQKQNVSDHCTFKPVKNAPYYVVNLVGGGGAGSSSQYGGGAGEYRSFFVTTIEKELQIIPGKAGISSGDSGEESVAYNITNAGEKEDLATVAGGQYGFNINTLSGNNVSDCSVNNTGYVCNKDPVCIHYGNYIFVGYCKADERKDENNPDAYTSETVTYDNIKNKLGNGSYRKENTVFDEGSGTISYTRRASYGGKILYAVNLTINSNFTADADQSAFNPYLNAIGVKTGIAAVNAGNGGAQGQSGKHGAAVIVW